MNLGTHAIYIQLNEAFNLLLDLQERDSLEPSLQHFRESIMPLENLSDTEMSLFLNEHQDLIIKFFQFQLVANDSIWPSIPRVRGSIAQFISMPSSFELQFRDEVEKSGRGKYLHYIKD